MTAVFCLFFQLFLSSGGSEFNATQLVRMAEVTGNDAAVDLTLSAHQNHGLKVSCQHLAEHFVSLCVN